MTEIDWRSLLDARRNGLVLGPPASVEEIERLEAHLGYSLPAELRSYLAQVNGFEDLSGEWQCSWDTGRIGAENDLLRNALLLDSSRLAFGDNGAGDPLCIVLEGEGAGRIEEWSVIDGEASRSWAGLADFWKAWLVNE